MLFLVGEAFFVFQLSPFQAITFCVGLDHGEIFRGGAAEIVCSIFHRMHNTGRRIFGCLIRAVDVENQGRIFGVLEFYWSLGSESPRIAR